MVEHKTHHTGFAEYKLRFVMPLISTVIKRQYCISEYFLPAPVFKRAEFTEGHFALNIFEKKKETKSKSQQKV